MFISVPLYGTVDIIIGTQMMEEEAIGSPRANYTHW